MDVRFLVRKGVDTLKLVAVPAVMVSGVVGFLLIGLPQNALGGLLGFLVAKRRRKRETPTDP
jgi:LPXTG-motif cell wall-anchored protein